MAIENQAFLGDNGYKTFYKGTAYEWKAIAIDSESSSVNRNIYYYSDSEPAGDGKYWHYVDNGPTF